MQAMGMSGISKSQVSRLCGEIDDKVKAFLARPIEGDWPYLWIDATYVKMRQNGRSRHRNDPGDPPCQLHHSVGHDLGRPPRMMSRPTAAPCGRCSTRP
ncbi:Putative transposase (fragment) [Bradyrhizobium sp. ORS 285]